MEKTYIDFSQDELLVTRLDEQSGTLNAYDGDGDGGEDGGDGADGDGADGDEGGDGADGDGGEDGDGGADGDGGPADAE